MTNLNLITIATSIITLLGGIAAYLTIRDKIVRLKISTQTGVTTTRPQGVDVREIDREITITVTNVGSKTVSILNLYCKTGIGENGLFLPLYVEETPGKPFSLPKLAVKDYGDKMPTKIGEGDRADYRLPRDYIISCYESFVKRHPFIPKIIIVKYLFKFGIRTTSGNKYESTFNKTIQKRLLGTL